MNDDFTRVAVGADEYLLVESHAVLRWNAEQARGRHLPEGRALDRRTRVRVQRPRHADGGWNGREEK